MKNTFNTDANLTNFFAMIWNRTNPVVGWGQENFDAAINFLKSFGLDFSEVEEKTIKRACGSINDFDGRGALGFFGNPSSPESFPLCWNHDPSKPASDQDAINFAYTRLLKAARYYVLAV